MLDIIFISYDEPNANDNWSRLKSRFPHAQRVHGVQGIAAAHMAAARLANTSFFYVVDGDAEVLDSFDFSYKPSVHEAQYVHIWMAMNPALGISYGYGGVKLFSRKFFKNITNKLDFSTSLTADVKIMPQVAAITRFNSDPVRAFRGAFRESVKLSLTINDDEQGGEQRQEAADRLARWQSPVSAAAYGQFVIDGTACGIAAAEENGAESLKFINDHDYMTDLFATHYPEIDMNTDPTPNILNPMKAELFFTTRIAGVLYDKFVLDNLKIEELRDACSDGQLLSKNWLVDELERIVSTHAQSTLPLKVAIVGGWIGTLALLIAARGLPVSVTSIDLDERACRIAEKINWGLDFQTQTADMYDVNYSHWDIIINTSSEHIHDIHSWCSNIPTGKIVILQNNNAHDIDGHVSTVHTSSQLREATPFSKILYEGTRHFSQYNRFMIIATS